MPGIGNPQPGSGVSMRTSPSRCSAEEARILAVVRSGGIRRVGAVEAVGLIRYLSRRTLKFVLLLAAASLVLWLLASLIVAYRFTRRVQPLSPNRSPSRTGAGSSNSG